MSSHSNKNVTTPLINIFLRILIVFKPNGSGDLWIGIHVSLMLNSTFIYELGKVSVEKTNHPSSIKLLIGKLGVEGLRRPIWNSRCHIKSFKIPCS